MTDCERKLELVRQIAVYDEQSWEGAGAALILQVIDAEDPDAFLEKESKSPMMGTAYINLRYDKKTRTVVRRETD
jgi:hypothetical protein